MLDQKFPLWKSYGMQTHLKTWRSRTGKRAEEVAGELGVTVAMWSRWETGRRRVPADRVLEIERVTGISRHELRPDLSRIFVEPTPSQIERATA